MPDPNCVEDDCDDRAVARLSVLATGDGRPLLLTIRARNLGHTGGLPVCADHLHALIDEALMAAQPPPTPPARESAP